jgi:hypothetical protein
MNNVTKIELEVTSNNTSDLTIELTTPVNIRMISNPHQPIPSMIVREISQQKLFTIDNHYVIHDINRIDDIVLNALINPIRYATVTLYHDDNKGASIHFNHGQNIYQYALHPLLSTHSDNKLIQPHEMISDWLTTWDDINISQTDILEHDAKQANLPYQLEHLQVLQTLERLYHTFGGLLIQTETFEDDVHDRFALIYRPDRNLVLDWYNRTL